MKPGTPGFVGVRLHEARTVRGLTAPALAEILGLSRMAISQYEHGQATPGPAVLRRLSLALNQPVGYFLKRTERKQNVNVYFRSQAAMTRAARERAEIRLDWLSDVTGELKRSLRFPAVSIPTFTVPADPARLDEDTIEEAAQFTRRSWGLGDGPISNLIWLLENNGVVATRGEIEEPYMDSFCRFDPSDPAPLVFLNADKSSAVRSRFDAAHELGHLVLHRYVPREYWSNDKRITMRESQAAKFAGAFLLPAATFSNDVVIPSLDTFLVLKPKWLVAIQAMLMRCHSLGMVSEDHTTRMWRNLSRRGWRKREPLDDELVPEMPRLLPKAIAMLAERNASAPADLVRTMDMSPVDIAQLTMVPMEMFQEPRDPKIILFPA